MINLTKYLSLCKVLSRRAGAEAVRRGRVTVNGALVTEPATPVDETSAIVTLDGAPLQIVGDHEYVILNKPAGYLCTKAEIPGEKIIYNFLDNKKLSYVGRLDKPSCGMLLLSTDGAWIQRIAHPRSRVLKCYFVTTDRPLTPTEIVTMRRGVRHLGEFLRPEAVASGDGGVFFVLNEGRKREIRRLVAGCSTAKIEILRRISTGALELGELSEGDSRALSPEERRLAATPDRLPASLEFLLQK